MAAALAKTAVIATSPAGCVAISYGAVAAAIRSRSRPSNAFAAKIAAKVAAGSKSQRSLLLPNVVNHLEFGLLCVDKACYLILYPSIGLFLYISWA